MSVLQTANAIEGEGQGGTDLKVRLGGIRNILSLCQAGMSLAANSDVDRSRCPQKYIQALQSQKLDLNEDEMGTLRGDWVEHIATLYVRFRSKGEQVLPVLKDREWAKILDNFEQFLNNIRHKSAVHSVNGSQQLVIMVNTRERKFKPMHARIHHGDFEVFKVAADICCYFENYLNKENPNPKWTSIAREYKSEETETQPTLPIEIPLEPGWSILDCSACSVNHDESLCETYYDLMSALLHKGDLEKAGRSLQFLEKMPPPDFPLSEFLFQIHVSQALLCVYRVISTGSRTFSLMEPENIKNELRKVKKLRKEFVHSWERESFASPMQPVETRKRDVNDLLDFGPKVVDELLAQANERVRDYSQILNENIDWEYLSRLSNSSKLKTKAEFTKQGIFDFVERPSGPKQMKDTCKQDVQHRPPSDITGAEALCLNVFEEEDGY